MAYITKENFKIRLLYAGELHRTHSYWLLMVQFDQKKSNERIPLGGILVGNGDSSYIEKRCKDNPLVKKNVNRVLNALNSLPVHRQVRHNLNHHDVVYIFTNWFFYRRQCLNIFEVIADNELSPEQDKEIVDFINQTWGSGPKIAYILEKRKS